MESSIINANFNFLITVSNTGGLLNLASSKIKAWILRILSLATYILNPWCLNLDTACIMHIGSLKLYLLIIKSLKSLHFLNFQWWMLKIECWMCSWSNDRNMCHCTGRRIQHSNPLSPVRTRESSCFRSFDGEFGFYTRRFTTMNENMNPV